MDILTVRRAQRGDRQAQEAVLRRCAGPVHALVRRCGAVDPEDVCQEILRKVLEQLPRFDPAGPAQLTTWAFVIAHRTVLDLRKRRHLTLAGLDEAAEVPDPGISLEVVVERGELRNALEGAIGRLPEAQRRIFVLAEVHDQPLEAIAQVEQVPVGTVKSRLHRARATLALWLSSSRGAARPGKEVRRG